MAKRKFSILIFAVCILLFACILCGCNNEPPCNEDYDTTDGIALSKNVREEIIAAFVNAHSNDGYPVNKDEISLRCYGAFDGVYVLFVDVASWGYPDVIEEDVIAGVEFIYSCGQKMTVYSEGAFYSIAEAYEQYILSFENMSTAQENYKACHEFLYQTEDY